MPKAVPAAAVLRAHPDRETHQPQESPASRPQLESPAPFARASAFQPYPQPLRSRIATAAPPASDRPIATKDHAPHPYSVHDTTQLHTAAAPLSLQSR